MSQRLTAEEKRRQKQQATIGLASNILGISAGTAALAASARNKAFKNPNNANNAGPVTSKILTKIKMSPKNKRRLILAGAGGAVGLQAANLGGDLVTNRVLAREVKKNDMTMISKADGAVSRNGHGKSLVEKAYRRFDPEADRQRRMGQAQGVSLATGILAGAGAKKHFTTELKHKGKDVLGIAAKPGQGRRGVALAGLSAIATAGGLASYKRSLSARNQPWT